MDNRRDHDVSAVVPLPEPAAGGVPAAFAGLAGVPVLVRLVRTLLDAAVAPRRIVVAAADALVDDARDMLAAWELSGVRVVAAGGTRVQCLTAAVDVLAADRVSASVIVCDAHQPLTTVDLCARVIAQLRASGAVVMPALPVTDSVKVVDANGKVTGTLDRSALRAVQFPRGFTVAGLRDLLARRVSDQFDEIGEAVRAGMAVTLVDGDPAAFAADLPRDTRFVEAVMAGSPRRDT